MTSEAEKFLGIKPEQEKKSVKQRFPVFGVLSIIAPICGIPFAFVVASDTSAGGEGWGRFAAFVLTAFLSLVVGGISGIVGLIRSEEFIIISAIGFFLSLIPLLWLLTA